jgi:hypothetical protein
MLVNMGRMSLAKLRVADAGIFTLHVRATGLVNNHFRQQRGRVKDIASPFGRRASLTCRDGATIRRRVELLPERRLDDGDVLLIGAAADADAGEHMAFIRERYASAHGGIAPP